MHKKTVKTTPQGHKVGDTVKTIPFVQIDGNNFPVIKGVVTKIEHVLFDDGLQFFKVSMNCKRNSKHWRRLEIDSIYITQDTNHP